MEHMGIIDVWPTSPLQEGLFALNKLAQGKDPYHIQFLFRMEGKIDQDLLKNSTINMLNRYPNLTAAFFDEDLEHPIQIIPETIELKWNDITIDKQEMTLTQCDAKVIQLAKKEFGITFNLTDGCALRFLFIKLDKDLNYLVLTSHHIIIDGWSLPLFFKELMKIYLAKNNLDLLTPPPAYKDYIYWLSQRSKNKALEKWGNYLNQVKNPTLLSTSNNIEFNINLPSRYQLALSQAETEKLIVWCKKNELTVNTVFLFAWAFVLGSITNQSDVLFGLTTSGRPADLEGVDSMIGLFINTIPCRVKLVANQTILSQCQQLQQELFKMREYEFVGLSDIQRQVKMGNLFDSLVIFQNTPASADEVFQVGNTTVSSLKSVDSTHYPLTLVGALFKNQFKLEAETRSDLVDTINSEYIVKAMLNFLNQLAQYEHSYLSLVPLLNDISMQTDCNQLDYAYHSVWELVQQNKEKNPSATALIVAQDNKEEKCLTWQDFVELVNKIAYLIRAKIGTKIADYPCRIGLFLSRNEYLVASIFASIKLNCSIVPLDNSFPQQRVRQIALQSDLKLIISDRALLIENIEILNLTQYDYRQIPLDSIEEQAISLEQELYTIFTSGSSGEPKGVMVSHKNILALMQSHKDLYLDSITKQGSKILKIGHTWSFAFDASWQPMVCFLAGNTLVLLDENTRKDPELFIKAIDHYKIDFIETSPTMLKHIDLNCLFAKGKHHLKVLGLGGEAVDSILWNKISQLKEVIGLNFYGPTEVTVDAVVGKISSSPIPVIGNSLTGTQINVLDNWLRPCPVGTIGELYLSGDQVSQGYLANAELTATRFIAHPNGLRMYRTGDLVAFNAKNVLIYHGRSDEQIKIRGFRVEPIEVEKNLMLEQYVQDVRVFPIDTLYGSRLAACVILNKSKLEKDQLVKLILNNLRQKHPAHLIPSYIIAVEEFPMTVNGKLDIKALPKPSRNLKAKAETEIESQLVKIASQLLAVSDDFSIDVEEDLRNLGLDSIMVIQLSNLAKQAGYHLTPRIIVQYPTIRELGHSIEKSLLQNNEDYIFDSVNHFALTPIMAWLVKFPHWHRFCQWSIVSIPDQYTQDDLLNNLRMIIELHPMLRLKIVKHNNDVTVNIQEPRRISVEELLINHGKNIYACTSSELQLIAQQVVENINPLAGINMKIIWFPSAVGTGGHILIFIHHLAVDGVSWRIILDDFKIMEKQNVKLMPEITPFSRWSTMLQEKSKSDYILQLLPLWQEYLAKKELPLGQRFIDNTKDLAVNAFAKTLIAMNDQVALLLKLANRGYSMEEILLTILAEVIVDWYQYKYANKQVLNNFVDILIDRENHGRDDSVLNEYGNSFDDLSRTIGWFTTVSPFNLIRNASDNIFVKLDETKKCLLHVPSSGLEYSLLYKKIPTSGAQIEFNYHGTLDNLASKNESAWNLLKDEKILNTLPEMSEPLLNRAYAIEINAAILADGNGSVLTVRFNLSSEVFDEYDFAKIIQLWHCHFNKLIDKID